MKPVVVGLIGGAALGLALLIGGVVALDAFDAHQERESYVALVGQRDSLAREVELCRVATRRLGFSLAMLESRLPRRRR